MTVYIAVSTRSGKYQQMREGEITPTTVEELTRHLDKIAQLELTRVTDDHFTVTATDDAGRRVRIVVDRTALFTIEYAITQAVKL